MKFLRTITLIEQFLNSKLAETKEEGSRKLMHILHANIKAIEKSSGKIITWSLSIIGGSFLAIISDEYIHPEARQFKYPYFIFIIGWSCIAKSIYHGFNISGYSSAAERNLIDFELLQAGCSSCHDEFIIQLKWFKWGLSAFGIWLLLYLCWWILADVPIKTK